MTPLSALTPRSAAPSDGAGITEEDVIADVASIVERTRHIDMANWRACADHFLKPTTVQAQWRMARGHLRHVPEPAGTVGLDLGCWCGFMTWMLSRVGGGRVWGSDVVEEHVIAAQRWTSETGIDRVHFRANQRDRLAYDDDTFDWVVTSGLYSNLNPGATHGLFTEIRRVLRPGGRLLFNDGGNIHHEPTRRRILDRYHEVEWGHGGAERPSGEFHVVRESMVRASRPDLDEAAVRRVAIDTCYQTAPDIERAARAFGNPEADGPDAQPFDPEAVHRPPVNPAGGNAAARANDPWRIRDEILGAGFGQVRFRPHVDGDPVDDETAASGFGNGPGVFLIADGEA